MTKDEAIRQLLNVQHLVGGIIHALKNDAGDEPEAGVDRRCYFNPEDPAHMAEADSLFAKFQLNDKRRAWFLNQGLQGIRMYELADVVAKQVKIYEDRYRGATRILAQRANGRRQ